MNTRNLLLTGLVATLLMFVGFVPTASANPVHHPVARPYYGYGGYASRPYRYRGGPYVYGINPYYSYYGYPYGYPAYYGYPYGYYGPGVSVGVPGIGFGFRR